MHEPDQTGNTRVNPGASSGTCSFSRLRTQEVRLKIEPRNFPRRLEI